MNRSTLKQAIIDDIVKRRPYVMVTLTLNAHFAGRNAEKQNFEMLRDLVGRFALLLDEQFHGTEYVTRQVPRHQRFDAICLPEKLLAHPHAHCLFFAPEQNCSLSEIQRRSDFLLQAAHSPTKPRGQLEMNRLGELGEQGHAPAPCQLSKISKRMEGHVQLIGNRSGIASYVVKEYNILRSETMTDFFFLSEFYSDRQLAS